MTTFQPPFVSAGLPPVNASRSKSAMAPKRAASAGTRGASEERPEKAVTVKRGSFNKPGGFGWLFSRKSYPKNWSK